VSDVTHCGMCTVEAIVIPSGTVNFTEIMCRE